MSEESGALVVSPPVELGLVREPEAVLADARKAALALTNILKSKPKKVVMNGEQYLEFEDWQTLGKFYGLTAKVTRSGPVAVGDATGFEATAAAVDVRTGIEVSAAEAMCLNDEEKWSERPKYEWHYVKKSGGLSKDDPGRDELVWEEDHGKRRPKKQRVQVGMEAVPMFQLRSMAQTRACAKALRNVLAWVVVMAGFKATPAEELDGVPAEPADASAGSGAPAETPAGGPQAKSAAGTETDGVRDMKAKFNGVCPGCGTEVKLGSDIKYHSKTRKAWHPDCWTNPSSETL